MKVRAFCELPAGLAALSLRLHGGPYCRPPISRMGNKAGYAEVILAALGLRSGQGAGAYVWAEADPDVRALLRAYPDPDMLRRIAEIIRGWKDEEPRALWERLRAERKARSVQATHDVAYEDAAAKAVFLTSVAYDTTRLDTGGFVHPEEGGRYGAGREETADRCQRLAGYASVVSANRLINVAGPDLRNTGKGGTTFGGAEFATPAVEVAAESERVAGWMYVNANSWKGEGDHWKDPSDDVIAQGITVCRSAGGIAVDLERTTSRWPPVAVLATLPTAAELSAMLGTPGDLDGVVVYMDPPYQGTTGYLHDLPREVVVRLAREYDAAGAVVCISEAESVIDGWHVADIAGGRKGQKRTFSKQQREVLTMNREPAHRVATQVSMFGGR